MSYSNRISKIRSFSENISQNEPENTYYFDMHKSAKTQFSNLDTPEKIARSTATAIENQKIYIENFDKIIGRTFFFNDKKTEAEDPDFNFIEDARKRIF